MLPLLFQQFMNKSVFFVAGAGRTGGGYGNVWVRFRFWYAIYEMVMIVPNFLIGFYMLMYRLVMSFVLNLYYAPALDVCILPEPTGWSKWEVGFCTYEPEPSAPTNPNPQPLPFPSPSPSPSPSP